jgi:hypothetical protein
VDSIRFLAVETISDRIAEILKNMDGAERGRQTRLAEIAGCTKALIGQLLKTPGQELGHKYAKNIELRLGWRADWILYGQLPKRAEAGANPTPTSGIDADEVIELVLLYRQSTREARDRIMKYARSADKAAGALKIVFPANDA